MFANKILFSVIAPWFTKKPYSQQIRIYHNVPDLLLLESYLVTIVEVLGNIRKGKDFKTFFTVMNYGHGDIQVAHKIWKFVTDCFLLRSG